MKTGSAKRIAIITLAVSALGALCGALLGPLALWIEDLRLPGRLDPGDASSLTLIGIVGGMLLGAVLTPIVAWLFLRRVSFGRAIVQTAAGILVGVGVGAAVEPLLTIWLGLAGFVIAAARLWWVSRPRREARAETAASR